jgi:hypothetical protein
MIGFTWVECVLIKVQRVRTWIIICLWKLLRCDWCLYIVCAKGLDNLFNKMLLVKVSFRPCLYYYIFKRKKRNFIYDIYAVPIDWSFYIKYNIYMLKCSGVKVIIPWQFLGFAPVYTNGSVCYVKVNISS